MLPFHKGHADDYKQRCAALARAGVIAPPDLKKGTPARIINRQVFDDLSFGFFVGWVLTGVVGEKINVSFLPFERAQKTVLVVSQKRTSLIAPGSYQNLIELDDQYLKCRHDEHGKPPARHMQLLCPVLNKLRYNLGNNDTQRKAPEPSKDCCNSSKSKLLDYFDETLLADPEEFGDMVGGSAFPLNVPPSLFKKYATGLDPLKGDFGKIVDELLLAEAMVASGCTMGLPHVTLKAPFESHEIDFLLYHTAGHAEQDTEPQGGWQTLVSQQAVCVFETTVGQRPEGDTSKRDPKAALGKDHPKNKLLNYLALKQERFKSLHFHYVSVADSGNHLSPATQRALKGTEGFDYWSLDAAYPGADIAMVKHLDSPVPHGTFRTWHRALVDRVTEASLAWAKTV